MRTIAATSLLLLGTAPAVAGPLESGRVAADARWVLHVDLEALRDSTIWTIALEDGDRFDIEWEEIDEFTEMTGLDPRTDLMSVTIYGDTEDFENDAVIIAVTNAAADEAIDQLMMADEVRAREIEFDGHEMIRFRVEDESFYVHLRRTGRNERLLVIAPDRRTIAGALDVIDGDAPSVSMGRKGAFLGRPQPDSFLYIAASDLDALDDIDPASEILALSDGFTLDVGERKGELTARAAVSAQDGETAEQIVQVLQGMIALGQLIGSREPDLQPLSRIARAVNIDVDDTLIILEFGYDTERLIRHIEEIEAHQHDRDDWEHDEDDEDDERRHRHRHREYHDEDEDDDD